MLKYLNKKSFEVFLLNNQKKILIFFWIQLLLYIFFAHSVNTSSAYTLGKTTNGDQTAFSDVDMILVSPFTSSAEGVLSTGTARIYLDYAGSTDVRFVIYSDSSGTPDELLSTSDELTITNTTESEQVFTFSGANQIFINNSTTYWLGVHTESTTAIRISRHFTADMRLYLEDTYSDGSPTYFTSGTSLPGPIDVYVTYVDPTPTPTGEPTPTPTVEPEDLTLSTFTTDYYIPGTLTIVFLLSALLVKNYLSRS